MGDPTELHHLRSFEDLLYDAVHLLYQADDVDPEKDSHGYEFTYVRSSILNTVLLPECATNCCLDALELPKSYGEDIDKLPFLSKLEFFLSRINANAKFDRGCKEVQAVAELKSVRDSRVHPKVKKKQVSEIEPWFPPDFGHTNLLKIPADCNYWTVQHAALALRSANDFFNLFFLDWCKFNANTVCEILLASDRATIPSTSYIGIDAIEGLTRAVSQFGIDFKFIGKQLIP